jgi:hypothetical protein
VAGLLAAAPVLADPPPHAKAWGHPSRHGHAYHDDRYEYDDYDHDCDHRDHRRSRHLDDVYAVPRLPHGLRQVDYRGSRYYYDRSGRWYRIKDGRYVHVAPPARLRFDSRGIAALLAEAPIARR